MIVQMNKINRLFLVITGLAVSGMLFAPAGAAGSDAALVKAIEARSTEDKARDGYRNPAATLSFFAVEPGMTVVEALPGGGWYSKILARYLGPQGTLYGVNYVDEMWPMFGFFSAERIEQMIAATDGFNNVVSEAVGNGIKTAGFTFGTVPKEVYGTVDRVLFIRALHNLNRFEAGAGTLTQALGAAFNMLKDGGMVGVVQHEIPESAPDAGADGSRGYLKRSRVMEMFEQAGFEYVGSIDVNQNPNDRPADNEVVWRLPPTYFGSADDAEKKAMVDAIGESNRMTLLFKKPES